MNTSSAEIRLLGGCIPSTNRCAAANEKRSKPRNGIHRKAKPLRTQAAATSHSSSEKTMTTDHALAAIQQCTAIGWNKSKPVPDELIIALCDALWDEGHRPQLKLLLAYLPN